MLKLKNPKVERWIVLAIVAIAGGVITKLPYLKDTYFTTLQEATSTTKAQLGMLLSMYGIVNFICYFPGGMLADKFSPKKLIIVSCFGTALAGFWYATLPGYVSLMLIHGIFGITTVFTFWAAMVKIANNLGDASEQGKMFGILEAGRGLIGTIAAFGAVWVFSRYADEIGGLKGSIIFYSVALLVVGILAILFISDPKDIGTVKEEEGGKVSWADFKQVAKIPRIWLCGVLVILNYSAVIFNGMLTPYLTEVYMLDASTTAVLSVIRAYGLMLVGSVVAGIVSDKMKSSIRFMQYGYVGMAIFTACFLIIPTNRSAIWIILLNFVLQGVCLLGVKALYFATIDEVFIPKKLAGTASGIISLVGYAPEIFLYTVSGSIVDNNPGAAGYRICFICIVVLSILGVITAMVLRSMVKRYKANHPAVTA